MTDCPNSSEGGCRCPQHHPGLLAFANDPAALVGTLAEISPPVRLHVVTLPPPEICHGYQNGCVCSQCALRAEHGGKPPAPSRALQPWQPRPARHRRAA